MIVCQVTGAAIAPTQTRLLTSGMVQAVPVRFCFSPEWEGLTRTAVFTAGSVSISCLLGEDDCCFIPWECLRHAGDYLCVGVYGTRAQEVVLPTVSCTLGQVCTGTQPGENTPDAPTATLVQSLLAQTEAAVAAANALRADAAAGRFRGEKGEPGDAGCRLGRITLAAAGWSAEPPFAQTVTAPGLTASAVVDLYPTAAQLAALRQQGVRSLTAANEDGVLTVYALGAAPQTDLTLQVTATVTGE